MPLSHTAPLGSDMNQKAHRGVGFMGLSSVLPCFGCIRREHFYGVENPPNLSSKLFLGSATFLKFFRLQILDAFNPPRARVREPAGAPNISAGINPESVCHLARLQAFLVCPISGIGCVIADQPKILTFGILACRDQHSILNIRCRVFHKRVCQKAPHSALLFNLGLPRREFNSQSD